MTKKICILLRTCENDYSVKEEKEKEEEVATVVVVGVVVVVVVTMEETSVRIKRIK